MIIQCSQCAARFRFDDALMREDGVWVRCGLCQYEFFQCSPFDPVPVPSAEVKSPDAEEIQTDRATEIRGLPAPADVDQEPIISEYERDGAPEKKRFLPRMLKILLSALIMLLVLAGVGFLTFPDIGRQVMSTCSAYLPWIEKKQPPPIADGIRVEALQQRIVLNLFAGNVRVVEGMAVNESGRSATRLQMKATMVDALDRPVAEKLAYAGNVLSDAELMTLTEEEMKVRLSNPEGSAASNNRIMPGARMPFMIVAVMEPPGVEKVFVAVAGVEALLQ